MKRTFIVFFICLFFIYPVVARADKSDKLMELLVEKKIVTSDEAKAISGELEKEDKEKSGEKLSVKYKKGIVFTIDDGNYSLKLNARIHGMYEYENPDSGPTESTFRIRRARILASGNLLTPWLKYNTQITLEGSSAAVRDVFVESAYYKHFVPRIGQYKVPYDREFLNGGFNLQLIERSIANAEFSLQRDIGIQFSGKEILGSLDYEVGIFNGSGANQNNVDNDYMYVGRLVWNIYGSHPYSESAVDNPSTPVFAIGAAAAYMPGLEPGERNSLAGSLKSLSLVPVESDVTQYTVDIAYKYRGFSLMGAYHYRNIDPMEVTAFGEQDAWGFYLQSGYFIVPKKVEVAGRYSRVDPDNPSQVDNNEKTEFTAGLNYYMDGHNVKTGISYSLISTDNIAGDIDEHIVRTSVIFQF